MLKPTIELRFDDVTAGYGGLPVLEHLSFSVREGERLGLIGRNGAGKTTTLATAMGLADLRKGRIHFGGDDIGNASTYARSRAGLGYVPQSRDIFPSLTVEENLRVFGMIYAVRNLSARIEEVLERFDLVRFRKTKTGVLSSGEQTRVSLAKAMINHPELLLLDEPTASLDPATARDIRARIREFAGAGTAAVLWTSHNMYEVTEVCDRVLFLSHGKVLLEGDPNTLPAEHGKESLEDLFVTVAREPLTLGTNGR